MSGFDSWGRFPRVQHKSVISPYWRDQVRGRDFGGLKPVLACGLGRSYGDSCLNEQGTIYRTPGLNRILSFDQVGGVLRAECGMGLHQILEFAVPKGWFLPVTPGTKFVTLGGAVANDIHGKNHHTRGTFGNFVRSLNLLRSDGEFHCSREQNSELFSATIGGLGLTGFIDWVELQLIPITSSYIDMEGIQFHNLSEFFKISTESRSWEYTVAWLDCVTAGAGFGRGIFLRGNHASTPPAGKSALRVHSPAKLLVPFDFPSWALAHWSIRPFNELWFRKQIWPKVSVRQHYDPFFYPLDGVHGWNRIYGKRGFVQFQCVVTQQEVITEMLRLIVGSGLASFLAVLKEFGAISSPGMLSFPRPGITLCLDFPMTERTRRLMEQLEGLVASAGGAMYPAKDAFMSSEHFQQFYPRLAEFERHRDPCFSSSFWRRVRSV